MPGTFKVRWRNALLCRPEKDGKYVVNITCAGDVAYLTTRSYNRSSGWLLMGDGELVDYWLDGMVSTTEAKALGILQT